VPCAGYVGLTNSKLADAQAGYEKALSCMGALAAGVHVLQFVGLIDALLAFDYAMAVIDDEMALMLKRVARGVEFSERDLALDEIQQVGPGGMFLETELTLERMKQTALLPKLADRQARTDWLKKGALDTAARAWARAKAILEQDCPSLFSPEAEERIRRRFPSLITPEFSRRQMVEPPATP
jgi:trimethylamine--corrinoid protein Co-methyltransferase